MIHIAKISNEERKIIFQNVAYEMGINAAIVEKDYWVCLDNHIFVYIHRGCLFLEMYLND